MSKQKLTLMALLFLAGIVIFTPALAARENNQTTETPLKVVTKEIPPFVFTEEDHLIGFSIDLWEEIALQADLAYELVIVETVSDQLEAVANGEADAGIAAVSMTAEREEVIDFSHPYFDSGLLIMTTPSAGGVLRNMLSVLFSRSFLSALGALFVLVLIVGHIIWLFERKNNPNFPKRYFPGVWEGIWWSAVTVTTVGYGDRIPRARLGRLLGLFWMFAGLFVIANFTATVTSQLTISQLQSAINGPQDLPGKRIATVEGSTAAQYLQDNRIPFMGVILIEDAYEMLRKNDVDAVVYDAPVLLFYIVTSDLGTFTIAGELFNRETYGIALPENSPYENEINRALLTLRENGTYDEIYDKWFTLEGLE